MLKKIIYDWYGLNEYLFINLNKFFESPIFYYPTIIVSEIFDHKNFFFHVLILLIWALKEILNQKTKEIFLSWIALFSKLFFAMIFGYFIISILKTDFAYQRPFCFYQNQAIRIIDYLTNQTNCYESFPSGHAAFASILFLTLWQKLPLLLRIISIFLFIFGILSRIIAAAHFPADILFGCLVGFFTYFISTIISNFMLKIFNPYFEMLILVILKKLKKE